MRSAKANVRKRNDMCSEGVRVSMYGTFVVNNFDKSSLIDDRFARDDVSHIYFDIYIDLKKSSEHLTKLKKLNNDLHNGPVTSKAY